jgi:hypothetical protein
MLCEWKDEIEVLTTTEDSSVQIMVQFCVIKFDDRNHIITCFDSGSTIICFESIRDEGRNLERRLLR